MKGDFINPFDIMLSDISRDRAARGVAAAASVILPTTPTGGRPVVFVDDQGNVKRRLLWGIGKWGKDTW